MNTDKNGVYFGLPRAAYDLIAERVNWSWLKHMKRSPFHFQTAKTEAEKDTDAMRQGRAGHVYTLERERFAKEWIVWDKGDRRGNAWKDFKAEAEANGQEILTATQYENVVAIAESALSNKHARPYLEHGCAEVTLLWTHEEPANGEPGFKLDCKGRIDFAATRSAILDLKTTRDAAPEPFFRQCWNLDYYAQAAYYVDGYAAANGGVLLPFLIVAVENTSPYTSQLYRVPERILDMGRATYRGLLRRVAECRTADAWPGYADGPLELELPSWASRDAEEDLTGLGITVGESVV